jgi:hypothetical protein
MSYGFIVTIIPRTGPMQRVETWSTSAAQAIEQVCAFFLCPPSICYAQEIHNV